MVTDGNDQRREALVSVRADILAAAADLIADQGEREAEAYRRGLLIGFGRGWHQGLDAGIKRRRAA